MLAPGGEATQLAEWARDTVCARQLYPAFVRELSAESGVPIDLRECGAIDLALDDAEWEALQTRRAVLDSLGIAPTELSSAEARQMVPALAGSEFRALWSAGDAVVSSLELKAALAVVLQRHNVEVREHTPISSCTWSDPGFKLRTPAHNQLPDADAVVIAAGAWSTGFEWPQASTGSGDPAREAFPIRGHLVFAQHEEGVLQPIVRHNHVYVFQRTNGALLSGSNEELVGFDRTINTDAVDEILARTKRILPSLFPDGASISWLGFRPGIKGSGPEVRRMGELPLWLAYGHYRNGILLAPHTAHRIATQIIEAFGVSTGGRL